ncbi:hypothetical protein [Flavivirga jejuensis]|uniref:Uncharacterized protein n=1 Tax=Flavivirga jejuensis TaxID=870487 RepID=A0ABT8WMY2_9FLAO|nr:hypothetical protein [Flavivirga jejuensis]MDO5974518.1 hypothetical protein [Flavivirga jejuensis]
MRNHKLEKEFKLIAESILNENKSLDEWSEIESDDMFQEGKYVGGFEAIEKEFCFSLYEDDGEEYWFQLSIDEIEKFLKGKLIDVEIRKADY